jgi:hypothetical protein
MDANAGGENHRGPNYILPFLEMLGNTNKSFGETIFLVPTPSGGTVCSDHFGGFGLESIAQFGLAANPKAITLGGQ